MFSSSVSNCAVDFRMLFKRMGIHGPMQDAMISLRLRAQKSGVRHVSVCWSAFLKAADVHDAVSFPAARHHHANNAAIGWDGSAGLSVWQGNMLVNSPKRFFFFF